MGMGSRQLLRLHADKGKHTPGIPTRRTETLVPKTENDVYRVNLGNTMVRSASNDREKELVAGNQAVVALAVNKSMAYAAISSIKALRPAAAM
jgi:hypothetical protein